MELKIKTWLSDIDTAIEEIESFLPEKKDFFSFKNDLKTRKAVERNIEIIGEAVNRIGKQDQSIEIIWTIVVDELPKLKIEVNKLLNS